MGHPAASEGSWAQASAWARGLRCPQRGSEGPRGDVKPGEGLGLWEGLWVPDTITPFHIFLFNI